MFVEFFNQNIWWFVALALVFNLLILSYIRGGVKGARTVSALEMPALQRKGKSIVLDVNKPDHFAASHIPNSANFPLEELNSDNSALMKHKNKTAIVVCQTGSRSNKAARQLLDMGFANVNILRGGLISWTKENLPVVSSK
jgi:rhodanese-related sulfurtransferase